MSVQCLGVSKTYKGGVTAVSPLDLTFDSSKTTALVGPSGCGKSTLLRMIAGLETPTEGRILIDGAPPSDMLKQARLSLAFQDPSLLPWRSVRRNIELALKLARKPIRKDEIDQLVQLVGLSGFEDTKPAALSGGMRQRAAIARALATRPDVLLLDEPFGAVDELTRKQLAHDLPAIWEASGTTTLLVTHSVSEAVMLSDRVVVLSSRPARVIADIAVPLARPRGPHSSTEPRFTTLTEQVVSALSDGMADPQPKAAQ